VPHKIGLLFSCSQLHSKGLVGSIPSGVGLLKGLKAL
jgi:hypothetical protein